MHDLTISSPFRSFARSGLGFYTLGGWRDAQLSFLRIPNHQTPPHEPDYLRRRHSQRLNHIPSAYHDTQSEPATTANKARQAMGSHPQLGIVDERE